MNIYQQKRTPTSHFMPFNTNKTTKYVLGRHKDVAVLNRFIGFEPSPLFIAALTTIHTHTKNHQELLSLVLLFRAIGHISKATYISLIRDHLFYKMTLLTRKICFQSLYINMCKTINLPFLKPQFFGIHGLMCQFVFSSWI